MKKLLTTAVAIVAIAFGANADAVTWFNPQIETYTTWPTNNVAAFGGEWSGSVVYSFSGGRDVATDVFVGENASNESHVMLSGSGTLSPLSATANYAYHSSRSINVNFTAGVPLDTSDFETLVGADGYAIPCAVWDNVIAANGTNDVHVYRNDSGEYDETSGVTAIVEKTRGYWSCNNLSGSDSLLHGYIDDIVGSMSPNVKVTGIPFENYRAVIYFSTDTANARFGHLTVNGINLTSDNLDLGTEGSYATRYGTSAWGNAGGSNSALPLAQGVNYLITPVLEGGQLDIRTHNLRTGLSFERGTIAAIQIVETEENVVRHEIAFDIGDGAVHLGGGELVQTIVEGAAAVEPIVVATNGTFFSGWDMDFSCVTSDMRVRANYAEDVLQTRYEGIVNCDMVNFDSVLWTAPKQFPDADGSYTQLFISVLSPATLTITDYFEIGMLVLAGDCDITIRMVGNGAFYPAAINTEAYAGTLRFIVGEGARLNYYLGQSSSATASASGVDYLPFRYFDMEVESGGTVGFTYSATGYSNVMNLDFSRLTGDGFISLDNKYNGNANWIVFPASIFASSLSFHNDSDVVMNQAFTDQNPFTVHNLSGNGRFRCDWAQYVMRRLRTIQTRNSMFTGRFMSNTNGNGERECNLNVASDGEAHDYENKRLILSGEGGIEESSSYWQFQDAKGTLTVERTGALEINYLWGGPADIYGAVGGCGGFSSNVVFETGAEFILSTNGHLTATGSIAFGDSLTVRTDEEPLGLLVLAVEDSVAVPDISNTDLILYVKGERSDLFRFLVMEDGLYVAPKEGVRSVRFDVGEHGHRAGGGNLLQFITDETTIEAPVMRGDDGWVFVGWDVDLETMEDGDVATAQYKTLKADLHIDTLDVPESATTGDRITIAWTVGNTGNPNWSGRTVEQIRLVNASDPLNVIVIANLAETLYIERDGGQLLRSYEWAIPSKGPVGEWYVEVETAIGASNEHGGVNLSRSEATLAIAQCPLPDLSVKSIALDLDPAEYMPLDTVTVRYVVQNTGTGAASAPWRDRLYLCKNGVKVTLATVDVSNDIAAGAEVERTIQCVIPELVALSGDVAFVVKVDCDDSIVELSDDDSNENATWEATPNATLGKRIYLAFNSASVYENAGSVRFYVKRGGETDKALVLSLSAAGATSDVTFPAEITIGAGSSTASGYVYPIDNNIVEGARNVVFTLTPPVASGFDAVASVLTILDNEVPKLTMSFDKVSVKEGDAAIVVTVTRELVTDDPLTVYLNGVSSSHCSYPSSVVIPAGEASVAFELAAVDNDAAEIAAALTLRASANGYTAATQSFSVEDDDVPSVTLTIYPEELSEGAGPNAAYAILSRVNEDNIGSAITVNLTPSIPNQLILQTSVTIPAYTMAVRFQFGPVDNGDDEPDRDITITGSIYIPSCGCSGQPSSGDVIEATIRIIDNDVPALSLTADPSTMKEGLDHAGDLILSHNSVLTEDLVVSLSYDTEGEIEIPASVMIPAGETSVTIPVKTIDDGETDGGKLVSVYADDETSAFKSASTWIQVSDQNLPDLKVIAIARPSSVYAGKKFDIEFGTANVGFVAAPNEIEYAIHLVGGNRGSSATSSNKIYSGKITGGIVVTDSIVTSCTVTAPSDTGDYRIVVVLDPDGKISELDDANNSLTSDAIAVSAAYTATVTVAEKVYMPGDEIVFNGVAVMPDGTTPAANLPIDIYVIVNSMRRTYQLTTDDNGAFGMTFEPSSGEAGRYTIGACYPGVASTVAQDHFDILGMKRTSTSNIIWDYALGDVATRTVYIQNRSGTPLTGLTVAFTDKPDECEIVPAFADSIPANGSVALTLTATAVGVTEQTDYRKFYAHIEAAEGVSLDFPLYFHSQTQKAYLRATPTRIDTTMVVGSTRYIDVAIMNDGKGDSGAVAATIPSVSWLKIVGGASINNLTNGESAVVTLAVSTTAGDGLALNSPLSGGNLAINCANGTGCSIPLKFTPVSEATGSITVDVVDNNTYALESAPHLSNATVRVSNPYTGVIVATGKTGADGTWTATNIPEGTYQLTIAAPNHETYADGITIEPGRNKSIEAFLQYQLVSVSWNVEKTEIEDSYDIDLVLDFETQVPAPIVKTYMPGELPTLNEGESYTFTITLENTGLIAAEKVTLTMPKIEGYTFSLSDNDVAIPAKSSVNIVAVFSRPAEQAMLTALRSQVITKTVIKCTYKVDTEVCYQCGNEHPRYSYPTKVGHGECTTETITYIIDDRNEATEIEPYRGGGSSVWGAGGFGSGVGSTYTKKGCDPCLNKISEAIEECGISYGNAQVLQRLFLNFEAGGFVLPRGIVKVPWWMDGRSINELSADKIDMIRLYAKVAKAAYEDSSDGSTIEQLFGDNEFERVPSSDLEAILSAAKTSFVVERDGVVLADMGSAVSIYRDNNDAATTKRWIIAFRGTEGLFSIDTLEDIWNKVCGYTAQYEAAAELLSLILRSVDNEVVVVGHSLGGGLTQFAMAANADILAGRVKGYTYNSAGICKDYGVPMLRDKLLSDEVLAQIDNNIVNVRNEGDSVSFWGCHIGNIYDIPNNNLFDHKIGSVIENLDSLAANGETTDFDGRRETILSFMDLSIANKISVEELECLRKVASGCYAAYNIDEDQAQREEWLSKGWIGVPTYNTGNAKLDKALQNAHVSYQATKAVEEFCREVMGPLFGLKIDDSEFNEFWRVFRLLAEPGYEIELASARTIYPPSIIGNREIESKFDSFFERWNNTVSMLYSDFQEHSETMDLARLNGLLRIIASADAYMTSDVSKYPTEGETARSLRTTGLLKASSADVEYVREYRPVSGYTSVEEFFNDTMSIIKECIDTDSSAVCASVTLKLSQTLAMTREAFDGTLTLYNGNTTTPITNLKLDVSVLDEDGNECKDLFEIFDNGTSGDMSEGSALAGGLSVSAGGTGSAVIRFIPERGAAPTEAKLYRFGGTVTYTDPFSGETATVKLTPVSLTVSPSPYLHLDYFVQRDVFADDPFTADIVEASMPTEMAVLVRNVGAGNANNVTIASAKPEIVQNEKGLAVDFDWKDYSLDACALNGATAHLSLNTVSLGTIEPDDVEVAQWWLTSSIEGHFIGMSATVTPVNSWNTPDTALVDPDVGIHKLVRSIVADADSLPDFLVCDGSDLYGTPNEIYTARGERLSVSSANVSGDVVLSGAEIELPIAVSPARSGWNYGYLARAGLFRYTITRIVRSDDTEISLRNVWITDRTFRDGNTPLLEERLHIVDEFESEDAQTYTVYLTAKPTDAVEVSEFNIGNGSIEHVARNSIDVQFSKAIDASTFTIDDVVLRKQGVLVDDISSLSIAPSDATGTRFTISGLAALCGDLGRYELVVQCAGIYDLSGQLGISGKSVAWTLSMPDSPYILDAEGRPTKRVRRMNGVTTVTSVPVTEESAQNLVVTLNGTDVSQFVTIRPSDDTGTRFSIEGLGDLQLNDGDYTLVIDCANLVGIDGGSGVDSYTVTWTRDTIAPVVNGVSRETGLNGTSFILDLTEDADPETISLDNVMLTRKALQKPTLARGLLGDAPAGETEIALPATARLTALGDGSYSVTGLDSVILADGTYTLYFDASGVADEAGNEASGVKSVSWTVDMTPPGEVADIAVSSEYGSVDTCVYTATRELTISGTVPESGLTVEVFAKYVGSAETLLAEPEVDGDLRFTADVTLPGDGNLTITIRLTDEYGNSSDTEFSVYVDAIALGAEISGMPEPDEAADALTITFLNGTPDEASALAATMSLTKDGVAVAIPNVAITRKEDRIYTVSDLANYTAEYGTYVFSYDVREVAKATSGMTGSAVATAEWVNYPLDTTAPTIADIRFNGAAPAAAYVTDQMFTEVAVRFSEAVNVPELVEQGIAGQAFSIQFLSDDNEIVGTLPAEDVAWNATTFTASWTIDGSAVPCGKARLVVDALLVKDASGNGLATTEAYDIVSVAKTYMPTVLKHGVAYSYACPALYDWNNDGLLDLIVGEKTEDGNGKVRIYLNRGTASQPGFDDYTYLQKSGEDVEFAGAGCVGMQVSFGRASSATMFLATSYGEIYGWRHRARNPKTKESLDWDLWFDHTTDPRFSSLIRAQTFCCDIDGDGRVEVVVSGQNSPMFWMKRTFNNDEYVTECTPLMDTDGTNLQFPAGQNHTAAIMTDVSGDAVLDLVTGDTAGNVWVYYGTGNARFSAIPVMIYENTETSNKRSRLALGDINGDGVEDILVGRQDGSVLLLKGEAVLSPAVNFKCVEIKSVEEALNDYIYWVDGADGWTCEQFGEEAQATVTHTGDSQTTVLSAKFTGMGTVTFTWAVSGSNEASEFRCTGSDSTIVKNGPFNQLAQSVTISTPGEHIVNWVFTGRNTAIVRDVAFTPADESLQVTQTTVVPIAFSDINRFANEMWKANGGDYEATANATAANGKKVMDNCIAGVDSSNPNAEFRAKITYENDVPKISWEPALNGEIDNEGVPTGIRTYKVYGTEGLETPNWRLVTPENKPAMKFFRVTVEMP